MTAEALSTALTRQQELTASWVKAANDAKAALEAALIERDATRTALMAAEARCAAAEEALARVSWEHGQTVTHLAARLAVLRARLSSEPHRMAHDAWCWRNHRCTTTTEEAQP